MCEIGQDNLCQTPAVSNSNETIRALTDPQLQGLYNMAQSLERSSRASAALPFYRQIVSSNPCSQYAALAQTRIVRFYLPRLNSNENREAALAAFQYYVANYSDEIRPGSQLILADINEGSFALGDYFFRQGDYAQAAVAFALTDNHAEFRADLIGLTAALADAPANYQVFELSLWNNLRVVSFQSRDEAEAVVHVFFNQNRVLTVLTGEASLTWRSRAGSQENFTLATLFQGQSSRDLSAIIRIDLEVPGVYSQTFGTVVFQNPDLTIESNNSLLELDLPAGMFTGLSRTVFSSQTAAQLGFNGEYDPGPREITLHRDTETRTIVHEFVHHFFNSVISSQLSALVQGLCWDLAAGRRMSDDPADFIGSWIRYVDENGSYCASDACWPGAGINVSQVPHPYPMENPDEHLAEFGEEYVAEGAWMRVNARQQLEDGNYEPAAMYLFFRYMVFEGREYGDLTGVGPSLDYGEVRAAILTLQHEHPASPQVSLLLDELSRRISER